MSLNARLARVPNAPNMVIAAASILSKEYGFYFNEVHPAAQFVSHMIAGKRTGLVAWPMQSGKTNIIACIFHLLKALIPEIRGVFICANDQTDLRRQNLERLEHIPDLEVLSRSDRKHWEKYAMNAPLMVFYDESHFGDGVDMTVNDFLEKNNFKRSPNVGFCGMSATPFTSLNSLDFQIWPDMDALEAAGYNSPNLMLKKERIQQADVLFVRPDAGGPIEINKESNVFKHIMEIMNRPIQKGYGLIRATFEEARCLEIYLKMNFYNKIFIKHWNMHAKDFAPESFFSTPRTGVFSLVMVQHKARMGNTIDTKHFEFMYENIAVSSHLDTILQSFIGRACGFGKQDHKAIIYSNPEMAKAYTLLINSKGSESALTRFKFFCLSNEIKPAMRATFHSRQPEYAVEVIAEKAFKDEEEEKIRHWIRKMTASGDFKEGSIRTLSRTTIPARKRGRLVFHPEYTDSSMFCGTTPGDWSAFIYDNYKQGSVITHKDWKGIVVRIAKRTNKRLTQQIGVGPTEHSLHSTFNELNQ